MFCFAAIQALTAALGALLGRIAPRLQSLACQLWDCGTVDTVTLAACVPATVTVVVWFIGRHSMWAWPLQDAMGIALIMLLLRQFRLPDIKVGILLLSIVSSVHINYPCAWRSHRSVQIFEIVICIQESCCKRTGDESALTKSAVMQVACILLPLCFAYDIFWVFITPLMMGGKSVMVEVRPLTRNPWPLEHAYGPKNIDMLSQLTCRCCCAIMQHAGSFSSDKEIQRPLYMVQVATGGESHEVLPMLLIVPTWFGGANGEMALLGFGDVVLPGLLLVYTRIFDLQHHRSLITGYFVPASVGYGVGLLLTYVALCLNLGGDQVSRPPICTLCSKSSAQ